MDITVITQLISSIGFPIAVALWFMFVGHKDSEKEVETLLNLTNAVENNTRLIEKLYDKEIKENG